MDIVCVVIFSVFMVLLPEGGMLRFYLEPARIYIRYFLELTAEVSILTIYLFDVAGR